MIMTTFTESYDFSGKIVHPVTTYAMSGLGTTPDDYERSCRGARIATGLAVRGERRTLGPRRRRCVAAPNTPVDRGSAWLREAR